MPADTVHLPIHRIFYGLSIFRALAMFTINRIVFKSFSQYDGFFLIIVRNICLSRCIPHGVTGIWVPIVTVSVEVARKRENQ
ncbi:MAG: hypothetical protein A2284_07620 [Deltaproteobacteria bacterium RIFOXYA12_FULL_61_11]|nr:MAG: hypothetical protein A2284_07620 [Deltaproteobacteria bacterium RIFOXYA12_FULL_61_11]